MSQKKNKNYDCNGNKKNLLSAPYRTYKMLMLVEHKVETQIDKT